MKIKVADDVPPEAVEMEGASGVEIRLLIHQADQAPNFYMRQFTIAAGGHTPRHVHAWEHEMYVLAGSGLAVTPDGRQPIGAGHCVYVAPGDDHQFVNTGSEDLKLLCLVPKT